jgi:hypothetical protein
VAGKREAEAVEAIKALGAIVSAWREAVDAAANARRSLSIPVTHVDTVSNALSGLFLEAGILNSRDLAASLSVLRQLGRQRERSEKEKRADAKIFNLPTLTSFPVEA